MPSYDFRCKACGTEFTTFYKTYADYDVAVRVCPECQSQDLARVINRINVQSPSRDFTKMQPQEMLSVFESGDSKQVGKMFQQVGASVPQEAMPYHEVTQRLLKGESMDTVEKTMQERKTEATTKEKKPKKGK